MRTISLFARALLVCSSLALVTQPCAADDGLPEPNCWRQLAFSIPFKVADANTPEERRTEIRLYVSANQGTKWDLAQTVSPENRSFTFRAAGDGEYWFLIRTVDRSGRITPEVGGRPELRVIIDTVPPRLDLTATRGENGEIKANWFAVDPLLNGDTLKIDYQTTGGKWQTVAIDRNRLGTDRSTSKGTVTWWPNNAPSDVRIRAEVSDRAGNVTSHQAKAEPRRGPTPREDLTAKVVTPQPQSNPSSYPTTPFDSVNPQDVAAAQRNPNGAKGSPRNIVARNERSFSQTADSNPPFSGSDTGRSTSWPADHTASGPLGRNPIPNVGGQDSFAASGNSQTSPSQMPDWQPPPGGNPSYNQPSDGFVTADNRGREGINPPIRNQVLPKSKDRNADKSSNGFSNREPIALQNDATLPAGERPRMVNSKSFEMDYEVDSVGPSGIAKVELWSTRDSGRTWNVQATDNDNRSPIRVNVDGEGLYGFSMVVQSGNGLAGKSPRSGDAPEVWVGVDLSKPAARLTGIQIGEGPHAGELLIQWQASDKYLAARPVTLLFSEKTSGPWSIIAAGLENSGQYAWRPDSRVPQRIFLRLEVRDEAGNTSTFDATDPVSLEQVQPEGKIRGVRSVGDVSMGQRQPVTTWR